MDRPRTENCSRVRKQYQTVRRSTHTLRSVSHRSDALADLRYTSHEGGKSEVVVMSERVVLDFGAASPHSHSSSKYSI